MFGLTGGFGLVGVGLGPGDAGFIPDILTCWWLEVPELLLPDFLLSGTEGGG